MGRIEDSTLLTAAQEVADDDWAKFISTPQTAAFAGNLVIFGPPGHGKTTVSATLSEFFPTDRLDMTPAQLVGQRMVDLEDLFWVSYDPAATAALAQFRVKVRALEMREVFQSLGPAGPQAWSRRAGEILDSILPKKLKAVVDDTVSSYDHRLVEYHDTNPPKTSSGSIDVRAKWIIIRTAHLRRKHQTDAVCASRGAQLVTLAHAAASLEADGKDRAAELTNTKREAEGQEGNIVPLITGKAQSAFKGDSSLQLVLMKETLGRETKRFLYRELDGWECKSRLSGFLDAKEPANLQAIMRKIRTAIEAEAGSPKT